MTGLLGKGTPAAKKLRGIRRNVRKHARPQVTRAAAANLYVGIAGEIASY